MTAAPEATTTDVANLTAGNGTAVLERYESTDSVVGHDVWLKNSQIAAGGCDSAGDLRQMVTAACCAAQALSRAHGGQR